jgi:hypothetical protein
MELMSGQTAKNLKDNGRTENKTAKEYSQTSMDNQDEAFGKMDKG